MTDQADSISDDAGKGTGKTLATRPEAPTGVDPFASDEGMPGAAAARSSLRAKMLDYGAHAAMIVGLAGFAWTVGDHVVHRNAATDIPAKTAGATAIPRSASPAAPVDALAELRSHNKTLSEDVVRLQARLDGLQRSLGDQARVSAEVKVLQAGLDGVKQSLGAARSEQSAAVSRLDGKIDKLAQHEPGSHMQQLVDRLGRLEHAGADPAPTASLPRPDVKTDASQPKAAAIQPKAVAVQPTPRPAEMQTADKSSDYRSGDVRTGAAKAADADAKPQVLANWVVRDVYEGVALIEGRRGTLEVVPGVSIPGAGVVKSIDRHGSGWTVTTTKGLVAYAAPQRDGRRVERGYVPYGGPGYRYEF